MTQLDGQPTVITGGRSTFPIGSTGDSTVQLWDLRTHAQVGRPVKAGGWAGVGALAVTEVGGRPVAVIGYGTAGQLGLWDLRTRAKVRRVRTGDDAGLNPVVATRLEGHPVAVTVGRGHFPVGSSLDRTVELWDLDTGTAVGVPLGAAAAGFGDGVAALAVTQVDDHPVVIAGSRYGKVRLWELGPVRYPRTRLFPVVKAMSRSFADSSAFDLIRLGLIGLSLAAAVVLTLLHKPHGTELLHSGYGGWILGAWLVILALTGLEYWFDRDSRRQRAVEPSDTYETGSRVTALCCRPGPGGQYVYVGSGHTVMVLSARRRPGGQAPGLVPVGICVDVRASITSLMAVEPASLLVGTIKGMVLLDLADPPGPPAPSDPPGP